MGRRPTHRQPSSNSHGGRNRPITVIDLSDEERALDGGSSNDSNTRDGPTIIDASDEESSAGKFVSPTYTHL